jgi:hypothetical protein
MHGLGGTFGVGGAKVQVPGKRRVSWVTISSDRVPLVPVTLLVYSPNQEPTR